MVVLGVFAGLGLTAGESSRQLVGTVVQVVDGDTIHVRIGSRTEKVRYVGVNTPEVNHPIRGAEPGGAEATGVNRQLVEGRTVRLELGVPARSSGRDRRGSLG